MTLTEKQRRWAKNKAHWEHITTLGVLQEWTPPEDKDLTPCGCSSCYGCEICVGSN